MAQATLSIRVDEDIKRGFDRFCTNAGMSTSVAMNMFVRAVLRENRIPFEIKGYEKNRYTEEEDGPFWNDANQHRLQAALSDAKAGKNIVYKTMSDLTAMEND